MVVTDAALAQIPDAERHGQPILVRADGAGASKAWLWHLHRLRTEHGLDLDYSVGFPIAEKGVRRDRDTARGSLTRQVDADGEPSATARRSPTSPDCWTTWSRPVGRRGAGAGAR